MKRIVLIGIGIIVLIALIGGAAYVGGQLLAQQQAQPQAASGAQMRISTDGKGTQMYSLDIDRAPELPETAPLFKGGVFVRRSDNSVFIGTGAVKMEAQKKPDGTVAMSTSYDGPIVEIVFTHSTTVYRDVTMKSYAGAPPQSGQKIPQVLEPGSIDEIGENSTVQVWGERNGDRAVANVVVYSLPAFLNLKPGTGGTR